MAEGKVVQYDWNEEKEYKWTTRKLDTHRMAEENCYAVPHIGCIWAYYKLGTFTLSHSGIIITVDRKSGVVTDEDTVYIRG